MAAGADESAIAVAQSGSMTIVAIASRTLIDGIAAHERYVTRIVAEAALAPCNPGWTWYRSGTGDGFVRREDGSAFATGALSGDVLPPELQAALAQARRAGTAPTIVHAATAARPEQLAEWSQTTGVHFVAAPAWRWEDSTASSFDATPDFLATDGSQTATNDSPRARLFRTAIVLGSLALALHGGASLLQWAWLSATDWRLSRQLTELARSAGVPAGNASLAAAAIARRNAELRHAAAKPAVTDALPLLARAAPALGALPPGTLKSATYADDAWTFEFAKLDAETSSRVIRALGNAGVDALAAPTSSGTRMRATLDATAR